MRRRDVGFVRQRRLFCCEPGVLGYKSTRDNSGCASAGYEFEGEEESLLKVKAGKSEDELGAGR